MIFVKKSNTSSVSSSRQRSIETINKRFYSPNFNNRIMLRVRMISRRTGVRARLPPLRYFSSSGTTARARRIHSCPRIFISIRTITDTDVANAIARAFGNRGRCVMGNLLGRGVRKPAEVVLQILLIAPCPVVTAYESISESRSA